MAFSTIAPLYKRLGVRVKLARLAAGYTAQDLGKRLSPPRSRQSISAMETGRVKISVEDLLTLSQILDEPVDTLLRDLDAQNVRVYNKEGRD